MPDVPARSGLVQKTPGRDGLERKIARTPGGKGFDPRFGCSSIALKTVTGQDLAAFMDAVLAVTVASASLPSLIPSAPSCSGKNPLLHGVAHKSLEYIAEVPIPGLRPHGSNH